MSFAAFKRAHRISRPQGCGQGHPQTRSHNLESSIPAPGVKAGVWDSHQTWCTHRRQTESAAEAQVVGRERRRRGRGEAGGWQTESITKSESEMFLSRICTIHSNCMSLIDQLSSFCRLFFSLSFCLSCHSLPSAIQEKKTVINRPPGSPWYRYSEIQPWWGKSKDCRCARNCPQLFLQQPPNHSKCQHIQGDLRYADVLWTSDGNQNIMREAKKKWPLRQDSLNKTKPNPYLNVWARRGFTFEQSCSNMHYLHSVQLPSHCGLSKQYSSPIQPPLPKTSTQISLSLASYKDLSMNEGLC